METRDLLKQDVIAHNKYLAKQVDKMTTKQLLYNCHPLYRPEFAKKMHIDGFISQKLLDRLTKIKKDVTY